MENMELKIEHLCGYLPYGLKACATVMAKDHLFDAEETNHTLFYDVTMFSLEKQDAFAESSDPYNTYGLWMKSNGIKPILIPLDKLTNEQYAEIGKLLSKGGTAIQETNIGRSYLTDPFDWQYVPIKSLLSVCQYLYSIKADIHGLIEQGLAIDASTLETNPYQ